MIVNNTPVEYYTHHSVDFAVKREDLCSRPPAPPFSKMRGLYAHMKNLKDRGIRRVAYVETAISMAGWGVAVVGEQLGIGVTIFEPQYKNPPEVFLFHRQKWIEHGATLVPIRGDVMAKVAWNIARSQLLQSDPNHVLLPLGISFHESIWETAEELKRTWKAMADALPKSIVLAVGSGTVMSGLLKAFQSMEGQKGLPTIYGVMTRSSDEKRKVEKMLKMAQVASWGFTRTTEFKLIDAGFAYADDVYLDAPFPTNRWYDAKAYRWMLSNSQNLTPPLLFWNIGSEVHHERGIVRQ